MVLLVFVILLLLVVALVVIRPIRFVDLVTVGLPSIVALPLLVSSAVPIPSPIGVPVSPFVIITVTLLTASVGVPVSPFAIAAITMLSASFVPAGSFPIRFAPIIPFG